MNWKSSTILLSLDRSWFVPGTLHSVRLGNNGGGLFNKLTMMLVGCELDSKSDPRSSGELKMNSSSDFRLGFRATRYRFLFGMMEYMPGTGTFE